MRGSRRLAATVGALLTALLTALALVLLGAPPSAAGGPTSVLLASPTSKRTASLYGTDKAYIRLQELMGRVGFGLDGGRGEPPMPEEELAETSGEMINVTWMIHDVTPWRVDRVYPSLPSTKDVWIHTTMSAGGLGTDAAAESHGVWHKAKDSEELRQMLTGLGVAGTARGELPSLPAPGAAGAGRDATSDGDAGSASEPSLADQARWAIPALALGAALGSTVTVLLRRATTRRHTGPREPRQELLDT
jgi:hypothetical protein